MVSKFTRLLLALAAIATANCSFASDATAVWIGVNAPSYKINDRIKTVTGVEIRCPDASDLNYYRIGQKFYTKLNSDWTMGSHVSFENTKVLSDWRHTLRLELELNPKKIRFGENGPQLSMRNRWELRWKEGKGSEIFHRIRQQSKLAWDLSKGPFSSYGFGNEVFFEEDKGKITANRFYPVVLTAKHSGELKGTYYLMYQSKRIGTSSNWFGEYVLGTSLSF